MVDIPGDKPSLDRRVSQFNQLLLPGQPPTMHMGTMYLVSDLYNDLRTVRALYDDLIYQVTTVHPGEERHDTAKRYIRQAEQHDNPPEAQAND